jgi:hypothetical protein
MEPPVMPLATPDPARKRRGIIFALVVWTVMTGIAVYVLVTGANNDSNVDCGGTTMLPGDTCETRIYGVIPTGARSYDTERTIDYWTPWAMIALGSVGITEASRRLVRLRRDSATVTSK